MAHWLSIIPFFVVIPMAIITKQVLPSITVGLIVGSYILDPHLVGGIETAVNHVIKALVEINNIKIILFLYVFSGLVGIIKLTGGIKGFVKWASERIHTKKGALFLTWISTLGTFAAPSFRIVTIAPIMRALLKKIKMSTEELGFVIETTGTAIIVLIPIATAFVGYMTSVVELSLKSQHIQADPYILFVKSIPFNFFSFSIILLGIYLSFFHHSKQEVKKTKDPENARQAEVKGWEDCHPAVSKNLPAKPMNLIVPLILVVGFTLVLTYYSGAVKGYSGVKAFIQADVLTAMLLALIITVLLTFVFYRLQNFHLGDLLTEFINGANDLMAVVMLLSVVWGLSLVTNELGFAKFVTAHVGWVPTAFVPPVLFVLGSAISYFIGSAWGTWGILMPLGVSFAAISGASLPMVIGAVFASGAFGAFTSPLSDDTNTMAGILDLQSVSYAHFKLKPGLIAAGISTVLYSIASFIF